MYVGHGHLFLRHAGPVLSYLPGIYLWDTYAGTLCPLEDDTQIVRFRDHCDAAHYCGAHRPTVQEGRFRVLTVHPSMLVSYPIGEGAQAGNHLLAPCFDNAKNCWEITVGG